MSLICIGNWKHSSFPLHSLFLFLLPLSPSLFLSPSQHTNQINFLFPFLGSKAIRILFHSSTPILSLLNSQPPASRLDVCRSIFAIFFFLSLLLLVFFQYSFLSATIWQLKTFHSQTVTHTKCYKLCPQCEVVVIVAIFPVSFFLLFCCGFSVYASHTHTHAERDCRPTNLILLCDIWGMLTTPRKTTDFLVEPQQRV